VEIGPHPVLTGMVAADGVAAGEAWVASMRRGRDEHRQVLGALAGAWVAGAPVAWEQVEAAGARRRRAPQPSTAFVREPIWLPETADRPSRAAGPAPDDINPILGHRLSSPLDTVTFESVLSPDRLPLLADHVVFGTPILPATGLLEAALGAVAEVTGATELRDVIIHEALVAADGPVTVQTIVRPEPTDTVVEVFSDRGGSWRRHLSARASDRRDPTPAVDLDAARARARREVLADDHYEVLGANDLELGPTLRGVTRILVGDDEVVGDLRAPDGVDAGAYRANPALVDAAVQVLAAATADRGAHLPFSIDRVEWHGRLADAATSHVRVRSAGVDTLAADVVVHDADGVPAVALHGLVLKRADRSALDRGEPTGGVPLHAIRWQHLDPAPGTADHDGAGDPVSPAQIASVAGDGLGSLPERFDLHHYQGLLDALEELAPAT
jgi:acyl transferase domain-containing protein